MKLSLRPATAERLQCFARYLRRALRRSVTIEEAIELAIGGFTMEGLKPFRYQEVIYRNGDDSSLFKRTRYGPVRLEPDELADMAPSGAPIDLEQAYRDALKRSSGEAEPSEPLGASTRLTPGHQSEASGPPGGQPDGGGNDRSVRPEHPGTASDEGTDDAGVDAADGRTHDGGRGGGDGDGSPDGDHGPAVDSAPPADSPSRHIPAALRRYLFFRWGGFCAFPSCRRPMAILHHVRRFALDPRHDPDGIVPLCTEHEALAHAGLFANEEEPPRTWNLRLERELERPSDAAKARIDAEVLRRRRPRRL